MQKTQRKYAKKQLRKVGASSIKDMGKVMGELKSKHGDVLDFSKVSLIIKEILKIVMMKYPKDYLDEIKLRVKVSQVVGKSVQLKKRGKEFIGLSPFKNEKTPSFTVSDEKGFYHCFSSGEHGNIFDFLMKTKSIGFGEAVKMLALEAGMQPYRFSNFDEKREKRFQVYKNIFKEYREFFAKQLFQSENAGALNYLVKRD